MADGTPTPYYWLDQAFYRSGPEPVSVWCLFSGGHDSVTATAIGMDWARSRGIPAKVAHINTGIGVEETREYVRDICAEQGWPLQEFHPPKSYDWLVHKFGFPGPGLHGYPYRYLKERCMDQMVRESKTERADKVLLISGVRQEESKRRMAHVEAIQQDGAKRWVAPIWNWSKADCNAEIKRRKIPRNPVVDILHMSGECLCGAMASPDELRDEIAPWFPKVAERITELEASVQASGQPACRWGMRPPKAVHTEQEGLFNGMDFTRPILCVGCGPSTPEAASTQPAPRQQATAPQIPKELIRDLT